MTSPLPSTVTSDQYLGDAWTIGAELRLRMGDPKVQLISLMTDEAGAALIARGIVPAYVRQQAKEALEWCCTAERAPAHDKPLFDVEAEPGSLR